MTLNLPKHQIVCVFFRVNLKVCIDTCRCHLRNRDKRMEKTEEITEAYASRSFKLTKVLPM